MLRLEIQCQFKAFPLAEADYELLLGKTFNTWDYRTPFHLIITRLVFLTPSDAAVLIYSI